MSAKPAIEEVGGHPPVLSLVRNLLRNYEDHFTSSLLVAYLAARQARIISAAAETTEEDESQVELLCINILFVFFAALQCCVLYKLKRCLRWISKWQLHSLQLLWKWKWQKWVFHLKIFPDAANPRLLHPYRGIARGGKHSWDVQCCAWTKWLVAMRSMRSLTWNILTHLLS